MISEITLVATDLDGTLFYDRERIADCDRAMLSQLKALGILPVFATGREMRLITPALDNLRLWDAPRYIIHSGGSGIFDVETRTDRCIAAMEPATLRDVYARYRNVAGMSFLLMQDGIMHTDVLTDILRHESALLGCPIKEDKNFAALLTRPNSKLVVCGTQEQIACGLPVLCADNDPRYQFHRSHDNYIDCYVRGVDKATALQTLCQALSIPLARTLAIGDNLNDLQLLRAAGHAACPGDAHPDILPLVNYVACPARLGAFSDACRRFIPYCR